MQDSDRILAQGAPITLTDGRVVYLRFGMRGLKMLEDAFGGVAKLDGAISPDGSGPQIGPLVRILACGLVHEKLSEDDLLDLLDPAQMEAYSDGIAAAFAQAFPAAAAAVEAAQGKGEAAPSPGPIGTTSPPSDSGAQTTSSGA